jgi:hypothetical protein
VHLLENFIGRLRWEYRRRRSTVAGAVRGSEDISQNTHLALAEWQDRDLTRLTLARHGRGYSLAEQVRSSSRREEHQMSSTWTWIRGGNNESNIPADWQPSACHCPVTH